MDETINKKRTRFWTKTTAALLFITFSLTSIAQSEPYTQPPSPQETKTFKSIKSNIIVGLNKLFSQEKHDMVIKASKPFMRFNDPDIQKIVKSSQDLIKKSIAEEKERIERKKQKEIKPILRELRNTPASDYRHNTELYKLLLTYYPKKSSYIKKYNYYKKKLDENRMLGTWTYRYYNIETKIKIYKKNNDFYVKKTFRDGSKRNAKLSLTKGKTIKEDSLVVDGSVDGERYEVTSTGHLYIYDRDGFITAGKPLFKINSVVNQQAGTPPNPIVNQETSKTVNTSPHTRGRAVSEKEFGEKWPFTVSQGYVNCLSGKSAVFAHNGTTYQLNGAARNQGYKKIDPIWRNDPIIRGTKVSLWPMIKIALSTCQ